MATEPDGDVPEGAPTAFWALVLVFNLALLSSSIGVMLLVFEQAWGWGGLALVVGAVGWAVGFAGYFWSREHLIDEA